MPKKPGMFLGRPSWHSKFFSEVSEYSFTYKSTNLAIGSAQHPCSNIGRCKRKTGGSKKYCVQFFKKRPDFAENIGWLEGFDLAADRNCRIILVNLENAGGGV